MQLICQSCGTPVEIVSSSSDCPECGVDLSSFLSLGDEMRERYEKAAGLTLAGEHDTALELIYNGLAEGDRSELHLLAALIHRRLEQFDLMRRHVAAIPVDDVLRSEGEWLLRSHQEKQRAARQAKREEPAKVGQFGVASRQFGTEYHPFSIGSAAAAAERPRRRRRRTWLWLVPVAAVVALSIFAAQQLYDGFPTLLELSAPLPASVGNRNDVDEPPLFSPRVGEPQVAITPPSDPEIEVVPTPTSPAVATPPVDIVSAPEAPRTIGDSGAAGGVEPAVLPVEADDGSVPEAERLVSSDPAIGAVAVTVEAAQFDLANYFLAAGRPDLAALDIDAQQQGDSMTLEGTVSYTQQRVEVMMISRSVPGVVQVDGVNLRVRLPETYTVEEDDTLWNIAAKLYGDGGRWPEIVAANAEILGDTNLLAPGQTLRVPPL